MALAGSDGINFFLYEREPSLDLELTIASTNDAVKAPQLRRELDQLLGLQRDDEARVVDGAGRSTTVAPPAPIARVLTELVATFNAADSAKAQRFIAEHFAIPDVTRVGERARRMAGTRAELGELRIVAMEVVGNGAVDLRISSGSGDPVLMRAEIDRVAPYRIRELRIEVGGPN